jgi:hypothetical protein
MRTYKDVLAAVAKVSTVGFFIDIFFGGVNTGLIVFALGLSVVWWGVVLIQIDRYFRPFLGLQLHYEVTGPLVFGVALALFALIAGHGLQFAAPAAVLLALWAVACWRCHVRRRNFLNLKHGRLPSDAWVRPPMEALAVGDVFLLSNGRSSSVGHVEWIIRVDGQQMLLGSLGKGGVVIRPVHKIVKPEAKHYAWIVLRPDEPLTECEIARAAQRGLLLAEKNEQYKLRVRAKRDLLLQKLPIGESAREWLRNLVPISGYGWVDVLLGITPSDHFSCGGLLRQTWAATGRPLKWKKNPMLGLFIGPGVDHILDRRLPFRLLTLNDRAAFLAGSDGRALAQGS